MRHNGHQCVVFFALREHANEPPLLLEDPPVVTCKITIDGLFQLFQRFSGSKLVVETSRLWPLLSDHPVELFMFSTVQVAVGETFS